MLSDACGELTRNNPDILATACPLCKKTFAAVTETRVADIAEIVSEALVLSPFKKNRITQLKSIKELAKI